MLLRSITETLSEPQFPHRESEAHHRPSSEVSQDSCWERAGERAEGTALLQRMPARNTKTSFNLSKSHIEPRKNFLGQGPERVHAA